MERLASASPFPPANIPAGGNPEEEAKPDDEANVLREALDLIDARPRRDVSRSAP
jgi:hypothetical protein